MLLRLLLGLFGLAVLLLLAVIVAVVLLVDPDDYREEIAATFERQTGRSMLIEGPLGLRKFPCCAITLGRTELGNPPGFEGPHFARLEAAELELRIWPLLVSREVRVGRIVLDGLDLDLVQLADGRSNWDFAAAGNVAAPSPDAGEDASGGALSLAEIAGIDVRRSRIAYRDLGTGADLLLENVNLQTGAISPDRPFDLRAELDFSDRAEGTTGELRLRASALADLDAGTATLNGLTATLSAAGPALAARSTKLDLSADRLQLAGINDGLKLQMSSAVADLALEGLTDVAERMTARLRIPELSADAGDTIRATIPGMTGAAELRGLPDLADRLQLQFEAGEISARLQDDGSQFDVGRLAADVAGSGLRLGATEQLSGNLDASSLRLTAARETRLNAANLNGEFTVSGRQLPGRESRLTARLANLEFNADTGAGRLGELTASVRGAGLDAELSGQGRFGDERADAAGSLRLAEFSAREVLPALGIELPPTADATALTRVGGSARWALRGAGLALREIDFRLDDSRLRGTLDVDGATPPKTSFDLTLDQIDLDRYLAPQPERPTRGRAAEPAPPEPLPLETIRELRLDGRLRAGTLTLSGARMGDLDARILADDGVLRLEPLRATVYGGTYEGSVVLDARGEKARLTLDQRLAGVQASPLLTDLAGFSQLSGLLALNLSGTASGSTNQDLIRSLAGSVAFDVTEGYFDGVDLWYEVRRARSLFRREAPEARTGPNRTPINRMSVSGEIAAGVLRSDQLALQMPFMQLSGAGGLDLLSRSLDYSLQARVSGSPRAEDGSEITDLRNVTIPLTIRGDLDSPRVGVDMTGLVRGAAEDALRQQLDRQIDRLGDRLGIGRQPEPQQAAPESETGDEPPAEERSEPSREERPRDQLRRSLRDLIQP
ncbi:MAG: AsmA family protein [Chromatiales bacterium]|nr:AsmA family protein [Chromatiales bacterium]